MNAPIVVSIEPQPREIAAQDFVGTEPGGENLSQLAS